MEKGNESKLKATAEALKKLDTKEFQYHKKEVKEVVRELKTDLVKGLTSQQAKDLLEKHGHNQLDKGEEESLWEKIKESFEDLLVRILLLAAIISFLIALTGKYQGSALKGHFSVKGVVRESSRTSLARIFVDGTYLS